MKIKKFLMIIIVFFLIIAVLSNNVVMAENYLSRNQFDPYPPNDSSKITQIIDNFLNIGLSLLRYASIGWAIGMLLFIAVKYMLSSNPWKKSQLKVDLYTYAIGAVLLFGAAGILKLISYFVEDVTK